MTTTTTRPRGVILHVLDLRPVLATVPLGEGESADVAFGPYAICDSGDTLYVICHEGVGWEITDDCPFDLGIYVARQGFMAIAPRFLATLSFDEVRVLPRGEEIDLADLVRVHNDRLENNFRTWYRTLTQAR